VRAPASYDTGGFFLFRSSRRERDCVATFVLQSSHVRGNRRASKFVQSVLYVFIVVSFATTRPSGRVHNVSRSSYDSFASVRVSNSFDHACTRPPRVMRVIRTRPTCIIDSSKTPCRPRDNRGVSITTTLGRPCLFMFFYVFGIPTVWFYFPFRQTGVIVIPLARVSRTFPFFSFGYTSVADRKP